jgi:hypothetical protein
MFANGSNVTVCGIVSTNFHDGSTNGLGLADISVIGGQPVTLTNLGDGTLQFCTTLSGTNCSVMPLIVAMCWTNGTLSTNLCQHVPLGLLEGYEIVQKQRTVHSYVCDYMFYDNCIYVWDGWDRVVNSSFTLSCGSLASNYWGIYSGCWLVESNCAPVCGDSLSGTDFMTFAAQPWRGLTIGSFTDGWAWQAQFEGTMRYRAPFYYESNTVVVLTFERINAGSYNPAAYDPEGGYGGYENSWEPIDPWQVKLKHDGQWYEPVAVDTNTWDVSYVVPMTGGRTYEITQDSFDWPATSWNYPVWDSELEDYVPYNGPTGTVHLLSFTGFHNQSITILEHDVGWGGLWGYGGNLGDAAKRLGLKYTRNYGGRGFIYHWDYHDMIAEISDLGKWSVYVYCGHGGVANGFAEVAGYTGTRTNAFEGIKTRTDYYYDEYCIAWYEAYEYRLASMLGAFQAGKGVPRVVIILACNVDGGDSWPQTFTNAGAKLVIRTGGKGNASTQAGAVRAFFESLAAGGTVDEAKAAGNKVIEGSNAKLPPNQQGAPMASFYGTGVSDVSTWKDLLKD